MLSGVKPRLNIEMGLYDGPDTPSSAGLLKQDVRIIFPFTWLDHSLLCLRIFSTAFTKSGVSDSFLHSSQKSMVALNGFSLGG